MLCKGCVSEKNECKAPFCVSQEPSFSFLYHRRNLSLLNLQNEYIYILTNPQGEGEGKLKKKGEKKRICQLWYSHIWDKLGQCSPATHEVPEVSLNNFPGILPSLSLPISLTEMQEATSCSLVIIVFEVLAFFICIPDTLVLSLFQFSRTNDSPPLVLFLLNKTCRCVLLAL